jgi:hypothetical protein
MLAAEWRGIENVDEAIASRIGQALVSSSPPTRGVAIIQARVHAQRAYSTEARSESVHPLYLARGRAR